ncbi:MAG TPA: AmmeMemoRadiSam system protein A, partial [Nitrospirota bacterium]
EITEEELPSDLKLRAGVFVCLKVRGNLRGCIGTYQPAEPTIARETVRNAISAATCDPRFLCVRAEELDGIEYSVDVLTPPEKVASKSELDPRRYGVIVQAGGRRGLLLPDLEGVNTVDYQISIALQKAGISPGTPVELSRFEVKRYY